MRLGLLGNHQHDQTEEGRPFDQRGRNDHGRLDVVGHFGLPRHALHGAGADLADAVTGTDDDAWHFYSEVLSALEQVSGVSVIREANHQGSGYTDAT